MTTRDTMRSAAMDKALRRIRELRDERRRAARVAGAGGGAALLAAVLLAGAHPLATICIAAAYAGGVWLFLSRSEHAALRAARAAAQNEPVPSAPPREASVHAVDMLEMLPDPIMLIGPSGRIEAANAAARSTFRLARANQLLSSVLRDPRAIEAVNAAQRGAPDQTVELIMLAPQEKHLRAFAAGVPPAPGESGRRVMLVFHDETGLKRAERMRLDFFANASHELRTPLASLAGFVETLRGHAHDDEAARDKFLAIMSDQAERMRRLIDDLLSLSRIELNEHVPPTGETDLAGVASDVVDGIAPLASGREVTIDVARAAARASVTGERDGLVQVVQNLVDNAVKYSPEGGRVTIEVLADESASLPARFRIAAHTAPIALVSPVEQTGMRYGWIVVRDAGPGVARRHLPRLAERFFRAEEGEQAKRTGTGLGLAIVKHIVARHRGGFYVDSAPGEGALFAVAIPQTGEHLSRLGAPGAQAAE